MIMFALAVLFSTSSIIYSGGHDPSANCVNDALLNCEFVVIIKTGESFRVNC